MIEALRALEGRAVCVHAAMRSLSPPRPTADDIIDALLAMGCTVMAPTFTDGMAQPPAPHEQVARNGWRYDRYMPAAHDRRFDPASNEISIESMGVFAERLLHRPGRERGEHPLCSFAAVGPLAKALVGAQGPRDVFGPLRAVCERDGVILLIGTDLTSTTLIHLAEADAGRRLFRRWGRVASGEVVACEVGGCSDGFGNLEPMPAVSDQEIWGGRFRILDARTVRTLAAAAIRADPGLTHCGRAGCERCEDAIAGGPLV